MVWRGRLPVCLGVCLSVGLSAKLVNRIETEPFQLGQSNLVHLLLMTRGQTLLIFKVRGRIMVWRGRLSVCLSGCLSVCGSVRKACK